MKRRNFLAAVIGLLPAASAIGAPQIAYLGVVHASEKLAHSSAPLTITIEPDLSRIAQPIWDLRAHIEQLPPASRMHSALLRILQSEDFIFNFFKINNNDVTAVRAGKSRIGFDLTDQFHDLFFAVRAGDVDRVLVIERELNRHSAIPLMVG